MSSFTTRAVSRKEAEDLWIQCRVKELKVARVAAALSPENLETELDHYAFSGAYEKELGVLVNFKVETDAE